MAMTCDSHREVLLDEALDETFPASDPIAPVGGPPTSHTEGNQQSSHFLDIAEEVRGAAIALLHARLAMAIDL